MTPRFAVLWLGRINQIRINQSGTNQKPERLWPIGTISPGVLPCLKTFIVSAFSLHQADCPWVFKDGMHAPKKSQLAQLWFLVQQPMTGKSFTLFCLKKAHAKVKPLDVILLYSHNDVAFLSQVRTSSGTRAFHYYLMVNNHRFIPSTYTHLTGGFYCSHGIQDIF